MSRPQPQVTRDPAAAATQRQRGDSGRGQRYKRAPLARMHPLWLVARTFALLFKAYPSLQWHLAPSHALGTWKLFCYRPES